MRDISAGRSDVVVFSLVLKIVTMVIIPAPFCLCVSVFLQP